MGSVAQSSCEADKGAGTSDDQAYFATFCRQNVLGQKCAGTFVGLTAAVRHQAHVCVSSYREVAVVGSSPSMLTAELNG